MKLSKFNKICLCNGSVSQYMLLFLQLFKTINSVTDLITEIDDDI